MVEEALANADVFYNDDNQKRALYSLLSNYAAGITKGEIDIPATARNLQRDLLRFVTTKEQVDEWLHSPEERAEEFKRRFIERRKNPGLPGLATGFRPIDAVTGGWRAPRIYIWLALPSMGKTALMQQLAYTAARQAPMVYFSPEADDELLTNRLVAGLAKVSIKDIEYGTANEFQIDLIRDAVNKVRMTPLHTFDMSGLLPDHVRSVIEEVKPKGIFLDYLQQMGGPDDYETITSNMKAIEDICKDTGVFAVVASQAKRSIGQEVDLQSAKGSGKIEELADVLFRLSRDKKKSPNIADIAVLKNRQGSDMQFRLNFDGDFAWFSEFS